MKHTKRNIQLQDLFYDARFDPKISVLQVFFLILYSPFGIVLAITRIISALIWLVIFLILPSNKRTKRVFCKGLCFIAGFITVFKNDAGIDANTTPKFIVANHTYTLEAFPLITKHWCIITVRRALIENWVVYFVAKLVDIVPAKILFSDSSEIAKHKYPFLVFAEGASTNGKVGLLKYNPLVFSHGEAILPVAIRLWRPFDIRFSKLHFSFFADLFWCVFMPWNMFDYTFLPLQTILPGESPEEFANRVQKLTAEELGIATTEFTNKDKIMLREQNNIMTE